MSYVDCNAGPLTSARSTLISFAVSQVKKEPCGNDTHGHPTVDVALSCVAEVLKASVRPSDIVARYGGEEFVILLPDTQTSVAEIVARRILHGVQETKCSGVDQHVSVTISIGIASSKESADQLLHDADAALYRAKNDGRNCIRTHTSAIE